MILAGIDEAGYGPLLGPLVVGCCALEIQPDPPADEPVPCLWKRLSKLVSRTRSKSGKKLHVNDSKDVYSPSTGIRELERSLLAFAAAGDRPIGSLDEFLAHVCPDALPDLAQHPWYGPAAGERFPLELDALSLNLFANGLRAELLRAGVKLAHLCARVIPEKRLNHLVDQTRNKASALFSIAAGHIDHLLRTFGRRNLVIFCDRQGGREHYGHLLRLMFEDWPLEIIREEGGYAEYILNHPRPSRPPRDAGPAPDAPPPVRIIFREKAESQSMSVALASMLSKYLRESLMRRFNAFWQIHQPGVAPTAGYYTDGMRFLTDIDVKRRAMGIEDAMLIRSRQPARQLTDRAIRLTIDPMAIETRADGTLEAQLADDPALSRDLDALLITPPEVGAKVILDFGGVRYVNSSNIARLLRLRKLLIEGGGLLVICGLGSQVHSVFTVTGLDKIFRFAADVTEARAVRG